MRRRLVHQALPSVGQDQKAAQSVHTRKYPTSIDNNNDKPNSQEMSSDLPITSVTFAEKYVNMSSSVSAELGVLKIFFSPGRNDMAYEASSMPD